MLIPLGLLMLAPVIMAFGSDEQKASYLPKILSGEQYWCQGYSEPGAGSDLASLKLKAQTDGDDYIVNGSKMWTTHAHVADHIFCLVRTDNSDRPQRGISFLLVDMDAPGITVEPIITMAGDHEVNQVFFDNVQVPVANLIGPENEGWNVAKYLLEFERGGSAVATGLRVEMATLELLLRDLPGEHGLKKRAAETDIELLAMAQMETTLQAKVAAGKNPGAASSLMKIKASALKQAISALKMQAIANYSLPHNNRLMLADLPTVGRPSDQTITAGYLNERASSIFGGAREVQKNIIAKSVLGL